MHLQCFAQIYIDIGTTFLYFQCFVTTDMFLFCKPINFSGNCRILRDLALGSVKTRFKAIKARFFGPDRLFSWTFAPGGRLRYEAYNVEVSKYQGSKLPKLELGINLQKYNSSFAPASQQRIKILNQRMERTNTKYMSDAV